MKDMIDSKFASFTRALSKNKMSPAAYFVLWRCGQGEKPRITDIVDEFQTSFPSVSVLVSRMILDGWLIRLGGENRIHRRGEGDKVFENVIKDSVSKPPTKPTIKCAKTKPSSRPSNSA